MRMQMAMSSPDPGRAFHMSSEIITADIYCKMPNIWLSSAMSFIALPATSSDKPAINRKFSPRTFKLARNSVLCANTFYNIYIAKRSILKRINLIKMIYISSIRWPYYIQLMARFYWLNCVRRRCWYFLIALSELLNDFYPALFSHII